LTIFEPTLVTKPLTCSERSDERTRVEPGSLWASSSAHSRRPSLKEAKDSWREFNSHSSSLVYKITSSEQSLSFETIAESSLSNNRGIGLAYQCAFFFLLQPLRRERRISPSRHDGLSAAHAEVEQLYSSAVGEDLGLDVTGLRRPMMKTSLRSRKEQHRTTVNRPDSQGAARQQAVQINGTEGLRDWGSRSATSFVWQDRCDRWCPDATCGQAASAPRDAKAGPIAAPHGAALVQKRPSAPTLTLKLRANPEQLAPSATMTSISRLQHMQTGDGGEAP